MGSLTCTSVGCWSGPSPSSSVARPSSTPRGSRLNSNRSIQSWEKNSMARNYVHTGVSFPGRQDITTILAELERQQQQRRDFVIPSGRLHFEVKDVDIKLHIDA